MDECAFQGFRRDPKANFTRMPNEWFDICMRVIDNLAELKCVLYVIRHTWGFSEYDKLQYLTVDDFVNGRKTRDGRMDNGTGLGETAVKQGLKKAIEHGFLVVEIDARDKGRIRKHYGLKMLPKTDELEGHNVTPEGRKTTVQGRVARVKQSQRDPRTSKEQKELSKENRESDATFSDSENQIRGLDEEWDELENIEIIIQRFCKMFEASCKSAGEFFDLIFEAIRGMSVKKVRDNERMAVFLDVLERSCSAIEK